MRVLPRSLFGRLMVVLAGGLIIAQLLSAAINFAERDQLRVRSSGMQFAQRIADIVKLLDSLLPEERQRIAAIFDRPPLVVSLQKEASNDTPPVSGVAETAHAAVVVAMLRSALGDERPMQVWLRHDGPVPGLR